jgi:hypothetical protein
MPPLGFDYPQWASGFASQSSSHTAPTSRSSSEQRQVVESPCGNDAQKSQESSDWNPNARRDVHKAASFETDGGESQDREGNQSDGIPMETDSVASDEVSIAVSEMTAADQINFERPSSHQAQAPLDRMQHKVLRDYWQTIVFKRHVRYGTKHIRTAEGLMDLGHAQLSCEVRKMPSLSAMWGLGVPCLTFSRL